MAISGGPKLSDLIANASVRNAMIMLQAIGGSTNGLIHLIAIAARAGARDLTEFLSVWCLLAEYNQFCHPVQRNAATQCKVMLPSSAKLCCHPVQGMRPPTDHQRVCKISSTFLSAEAAVADGLLDRAEA
jgi:Dehydratase family